MNNFFLDKVINVRDNSLPEIIQSLITMVVMTGLILLAFFLNIPNPNLILFTGLIAVTSIFGFIPGAFALVAVFIYTLLFFSNMTFTNFTPVNATKVIVSFITATACYLFVATLNHFYKKSMRQILEVNNELVSEKIKLEEISLKDELTDTKNRHSLRRDFDSYVGEEIHVMLFDVDEFKNINDNYGHSIGDEVLKHISNKTKEVFGEDNVYRFGGDEFVVIKRQESNTSFSSLIKQLMEDVEVVDIDENKLTIHLSGGFTYGTPTSNDDLRHMINYSDELLYEVKHSGKNNIIGRRYELDLLDK